ncbi:hypothetical protein [[Mycobacterium] zoologicum]|uniref:hypothetical protein n=1 Tax=[Mycobacterium] zoologicum TaxID=2872311 RepID=UPI001CDAD3C4|nr:hypothetical protein [Mycolicibacter sp. MYC101]MEB3062684.1 hypothetical protein [Mycolicibacter sp. MYC101]
MAVGPAAVRAAGEALVVPVVADRVVAPAVDPAAVEQAPVAVEVAPAVDPAAVDPAAPVAVVLAAAPAEAATKPESLSE